MKLHIAFITISVAILLIKESSPINSFQKDGNSTCNNDGGLWQQGKVPYEISQQFVGKDLNIIKEGLLDIMNTTCVKFVPRTSEPDYVVFVEYQHPNQDKKTCWSGNQWNNGSGTVGNKKGRHDISLWRELECFNKLDIIRLTSNILGFQAKPSALISKSGKSIIYAAYKSYEEDFGTDKEKRRNAFIQLCEKDSAFLRKYPYAFDKKEWAGIAKNETCSAMVIKTNFGKKRATIRINRMYNCSVYDDRVSINSGNIDATVGLSHVRPNCKTEAEAGACKSDPVYMNIICNKSFCDGTEKEKFGAPRLSDRNTEAHSSSRRANLINGLGKCLNSGNNPGYNDIYAGINLHQWDCDPSVNTMLYSWNQSTLGSKDRHICDGSKYCVTTPGNVGWSHPLIAFNHANQKSQKFTFVDSLTHPGFYVIKNDHGKCLSVKENTSRTKAQVWADDCNPSKAGQRWKWHY